MTMTGMTTLSNPSLICFLFFYIMFYIKKLVILIISLELQGLTGRHSAVITRHTRHAMAAEQSD